MQLVSSSPPTQVKATTFLSFSQLTCSENLRSVHWVVIFPSHFISPVDRNMLVLGEDILLGRGASGRCFHTFDMATGV